MDFSIAFILCVSAFTGALVQGASGFGFAIILMMIMPYFIPYTDALAVASFTCIFMVSFNVVFAPETYCLEISCGSFCGVCGDQFFSNSFIKECGQ